MEYLVIKIDKNGKWFKHRELLDLKDNKLEWDPPANTDFMEPIGDIKMRLNKTDKKIILQYLNEGFSLRKNMGENIYENLYEDSNIIHLLKALGYRVEFKTDKYSDIKDSPETRRNPV